MTAALSAGLSGQEVLGVMKCVGVRQRGQVRSACSCVDTFWEQREHRTTSGLFVC